MKVIKSSELGNERMALGKETAILDLYGGLKTPFSEDTILLTEKHKQEVESFALSAVKTYGDQNGSKEQTRAERQYGVSSLVARVDCTVAGGRIVPYELEDSPSGIGITDRFMHTSVGSGIKETVLDHYGSVTGSVPHVVVSGARRHGTDDAAIVGEEKYHYTAGDFRIPDIGSGDVIVKAIPGNPASHRPYLALQSQCLAPLVTEGDKSYLERLGVVSVVNEDINGLLETDGALASQVVKARLGSMAMGVSVYLSREDIKTFGKKGTVTQSRLLRNLRKYQELGGGALVQSFEPPIQVANAEGRNNAILRIFVLMQTGGCFSVMGATAIGGAYVARPELIVHGASNAVSGAVLVE